MLVPSAEREFSFIAKPFKETELSFRVGGPIDHFEVYAGNYYHRGDIIAEIDSRDFRIRKERAEAIYHQAKAEFERIKVLYEKNNLSASAYEKARADYTSAKTAYETAVNELEDTKLIAPFDGYIGEVYIEKISGCESDSVCRFFYRYHSVEDRSVCYSGDRISSEGNQGSGDSF